MDPVDHHDFDWRAGSVTHWRDPRLLFTLGVSVEGASPAEVVDAAH
jgi:hypothetical protein